MGTVFVENKDDQGVDRSTLPSQRWAWKVVAKPSPKLNIALAGVAQLVMCLPMNGEVTGLIPGQDTCPGYGLDPK